MKIAYIVGAFPSLSETFILNQITGLIDLGHEVGIFARRNHEEKKVHSDVIKYRLLERTRYFEPPQENRLKRVFRNIGVSIKICRRNPLILIKSLYKFKYCRNEFSLNILYPVSLFIDSSDYDIIHCHFGPNGNFGVLLKDLGVSGKLVTTFHAYDLTSYIKNEGPHVYDHLFQKGELFLAISEIGKRRLVDLGCHASRIIVHHMGVEIERFEFKERHHNIDTTIKILTVGRLVEKKGINYAIKAVGHLIKKGYDITYIIAGNGPLKSELDDLISQLGVRDKMKLIGSVEQVEVKALMMDSDIFLLPSVTGSDGDQEGIPVVLMEAMATGMPVISTHHSGIPEIVEDGKSGFLVPERGVDALAGRLEYLIEHPELWSKMGRAGREFVEKHYNIKKLNKQLVQIYERVLF